MLKAVDVNGSTPIHIATKLDDLDSLEGLLKFRYLQTIHPHCLHASNTRYLSRAMDIDALELRIVGGYAAVHYACLNNSPSMLELLLGAGADPNIKCQSINGEAPLHICCQKGYLECGRILLRHGASPDVTDNFGNNASFWGYKCRCYSTKFITSLFL